MGVSLFCASIEAAVPRTPGDESNKRALIIAIGAYGSPDWDTLSSQNDVPLVRAALERHGFPPESIHVLSDEDATKSGILAAIETHLASAKEGDIVYLHYSGHGQRIPDDDGDELDGYDESWVPYDAPKGGDGYQGDKHLRDDELNVMLQRLRSAVGPRGNVVLSIDSCFSGGTSRGTAKVRGGPPILRSQSRGTPPASGDGGGGFFEAPPRSRSGADDATALAPYVVLSAARHDQLDYETVDEQGQVVGPLSFALGKALGGTELFGTYRDLFEQVEWIMQAIVPNRPQVEGNVDAELFSGRAIAQQPFVDVVSVSSGKQVVLGAGTLQGLSEGSSLELHRAGTQEPTAETLLSHAVVSEATYTEALIELDHAFRRSELEHSRAFVTSYAFGDLRVQVGLEVEDALKGALEKDLASVSAVEVVDSGAELAVRTAANGNVVVEVVASGETIYGPRSAEESGLSEAIASRLTDYARSRYLRGLRLDDEDFRIALDVVPLDKDRCRDPRDPGSCAELDPSVKRADGAESVWKIGDYFKLRARNESERAAFITILDLPSDGTVNALWPAGSLAEKKQLAAGESWSPGVVYQFAEPPGNDVILLIATEDWIDFRPFLTGAGGQQRSASTSLGPFSALFDDENVRTRSAIAYEPGSVTTHAVTVTVEP